MELKELLKPEQKDIASIKKKMDEVNEIVQKMSTELYQKASQERAEKEKVPESNNSKRQDDDDNVVDADYKVDEDNKKK